MLLTDMTLRAGVFCFTVILYGTCIDTFVLFNILARSQTFFIINDAFLVARDYAGDNGNYRQWFRGGFQTCGRGGLHVSRVMDLALCLQRVGRDLSLC